MARSQHPIAPSHADQPEQPAGHLVLYHYRNAAKAITRKHPAPIIRRTTPTQRVHPTTTKTHIRPSLTDDAARDPRNFQRDYIVCVVLHPHHPEHHPHRPRLDFLDGNPSPRRRLSQPANTSSPATGTRSRKRSLENNHNPDRRTSASDDSGNGRCAAARHRQRGTTRPQYAITPTPTHECPRHRDTHRPREEITLNRRYSNRPPAPSAGRRSGRRGCRPVAGANLRSRRASFL